MEFKEAIHTMKRMCEAQNECETCPCNENCMLNLGLDDVGVSELEKTLEKWAAEHPAKTIADDFFEKHPKAPRKNGLPQACALHCGYMSECADGVSPAETMTECRDCWRRPLEEVEG